MTDEEIRRSGGAVISGKKPSGPAVAYIGPTVEEQIASTPFDEKQRTSEIIKGTMDRFKSQGITPDTLKDYSYVEVGGRRFYGNDPHAWNAMIDYASGFSVQAQITVQRAERRRYDITGEVPEYVKSQIEYEPGSEYKPLEADFERIAYEQHLGIISEEQAQQEFTEKYYETYPIQTETSEFETEQEAIRQRWSGEKGIGEQVLEFGRFWASGITSPENILYHKTIAEAIFGEEEGKKERILGDYTSSILGLEEAKEPLGFYQVS